MNDDVILLSERDYERFVKAIKEPAEPTEKLKEVAAAYKDFRKANPDSNW